MVLRQKEHDVERVRKEINALLTVIPLICEENPSSNRVQETIVNSSSMATELDKGRMDLELYYPFIRNLRS
jgi:hypothetical protein